MHELDPEFPGRLESFIAEGGHRLVVNTSGSGKTKLVLETLWRHWGLFITASWHPVINPHGSDDLAIVLRTFDAHSPCREVPLATKMGDDPSPELVRNRALLAQQMEILVLARLWLLDYFWTLASTAGLSDDDARIRWFWLQMRTLEIAGMSVPLSFIIAAQGLDRAERMQQIRLLAEAHKDRLPFVAIDEAQILNQTRTRSFASRDLRRHCPILREILVCLGSLLPHSRLIACGTEIDEETFEDAVLASQSTIRTYRRFCALGRFWDIEDIRRYMEHFLGEMSQENVALAHRYFRGRYAAWPAVLRPSLIRVSDTGSSPCWSKEPSFTGNLNI
ncbi:hypothetical protein AURDEDRAFT_168861 [Auricularia subglabra TFB-10046 SS5]|nr:hypothetical protein AURDEDRAFT_168861 [Auricularia subglabra TFB-10046 SS5]